MRLRFAPLALAGLAAACRAQAPGPARNGFDDPFFQIASAVVDCPLPAGPFVTEAEFRAEAHHRAEKGTSCWLAGECERANAYAYDRDIAAALRAALERDADLTSRLSDTSVWVMVQGRVVSFQGCAADAALAPALEAWARGLPHVQQAVAALRIDPAARPPYRVRGTPPSAEGAALPRSRRPPERAGCRGPGPAIDWPACSRHGERVRQAAVDPEGPAHDRARFALCGRHAGA